MNIHEYQAKELFAQFGVAVPKGVAVTSAAELKARSPGSTPPVASW